MKDAYGVFSVLPANLSAEEEERLGISIADLAVESGVAHLLYSSGASVGDKPTGVARRQASHRGAYPQTACHGHHRQADDLHGNAGAARIRPGQGAVAL